MAQERLPPCEHTQSPACLLQVSQMVLQAVLLALTFLWNCLGLLVTNVR